VGALTVSPRPPLAEKFLAVLKQAVKV